MQPIVDFGIQKVPFPGFITKIPLIQQAFSLVQKNGIKRGVPVTKSRNIFLLFQVPTQYSHSFQTIKRFIIVVLHFSSRENPQEIAIENRSS